jgi:hypothetical protein
MCEEAANYYVRPFQEKQAQDPEIILDKLREKQLTELDKQKDKQSRVPTSDKKHDR